MRMSAYYCDICGAAASVTDLAPRKLITTNDTIFDYSEVCHACCDRIDKAGKKRPEVKGKNG